MSRTIHLDAPSVGRLEKKYLAKAIDSGYISSIGPFVRDFEERFASYLDVRMAVSTQSGTAALHMALCGLGIGKGDEVIVPSLTFIATVNPVLYVGAKPVFVDVDPHTWNMDPGSVAKKVNKKTRAIIPVHLYGNPCDMDGIMRIARKYGLRVIEDATESLGAKHSNRHTGTIGDLGCFSFNGNKIMTTGGGGMVTGNDEKVLRRIKFLVNQAREDGGGYYHPEVGFNYRMTNIEAAIGLAQLSRLESFLGKKSMFRDIYTDGLGKVPGIEFQAEIRKASSSHWLTCAKFKSGAIASRVQTELKAMSIATRRLFMPLTKLPPYESMASGSFSNSEDIYEKGLCLPSSILNSGSDIRRVCRAIKEALGET